MEQQVILLTGASAGIGKTTAQLLMKRGAIVYGASRSANGEMEKDISSGGELIHINMDVNNEADIQNALDRIMQKHQKLDVVICNAGNGLAGSVEDSDSEEVKYQFETNFFGVVKTIQACLPVFRRQGFGRIINVSSVAAIIPIPYQAFYSSVKSASLIFMQALAMEVKPFGIQCCTVLPGDTKTGFTAARRYAVKAEKADSAYFVQMKKAVGKMEQDEQNGMPPEVIAKAMMREVYRPKMRAIVVPRIDYKLIYVLGLLLPAKLKLWVISKIY